MPRKKIIKIHNCPYHIWGRSNNKEWFSVDPTTCWNIFNDFLNYVSWCYGLKIHAFVLMNNHYHLLASTTSDDLSLVMNRLHTEISRAINDKSERINHVFGGRYGCSLIRNLNHYERILKYVYQNPIKAGLSKKAEGYKFSTLSGLYGLTHLPLSIDRSFEEACGIPDEMEKFLEMMNEPIDELEFEYLKKGLMKAEFKPLGKRSRKD